MHNSIIIRFAKQNNMVKQKKMYLILREDLAYKYIQGAHALAKYAWFYTDKFCHWGNEYLICLSVFNGRALEKVFSKMMELPDKCKWAVFREPDLDDAVTAICFYHTSKSFDRIIKKLHLASKQEVI